MQKLQYDVVLFQLLDALLFSIFLSTSAGYIVERQMPVPT
jgi:hypothetical protein